MSFDNVEVGRMQAREIFELVPEGNYIIIKGNAADANADFLRSGYEEIIGEAVAAGDITIVGEDYTDNWDASIAQTNTEQFLTEANNDVQAVLSENDGMAGGVVAALEAQGLAGQVPVSGQDGDLAALNRIALGTQTVSVWKDSRLLGTAAGEAALQLCANPDIAAVEGTAPFTSPGGNELTSILLAPQPITQDNLDVVVDAGWIDQETLCQGVEPGTVAACDACGRRRRHSASGQRSRGHRVDGHGSGDDGRLTVPTVAVDVPCVGSARGASTREWRRDG